MFDDISEAEHEEELAKLNKVRAALQDADKHIAQLMKSGGDSMSDDAFVALTDMLVELREDYCLQTLVEDALER
jgi:hypothetical protein